MYQLIKEAGQEQGPSLNHRLGIQIIIIKHLKEININRVMVEIYLILLDSLIRVQVYFIFFV